MVGRGGLGAAALTEALSWELVKGFHEAREKDAHKCGRGEDTDTDGKTVRLCHYSRSLPSYPVPPPSRLIYKSFLFLY